MLSSTTPLMKDGKKIRPKVGLVLGCGGLKSFSAISVFKYLHEAGIPIDIIVGTSGGALAGALYGVNDTFDSIDEVIRKGSGINNFSRLNFSFLFSFLRFPFFKMSELDGFLNPNPYKNVLKNLFKDKLLEEIKPTLVVKATDIYTGNSVDLRSGVLWETIYASSAIYPFMPPICINGQYLVDGAFSSPVGVSAILDEDIDLLIIISFHFKKKRNSQNVFRYFTNLLSFSADRKGHQALSIPLCLYNGEIAHVNMRFNEEVFLNDTDKLMDLVNFGEQVIHQKGEGIKTIYKLLLESKFS